MKMKQNNRKITVYVSLSADTVEGIDRLAAERRISRSAMIEIIFNKYLDAEGRRAMK
jgi:metal-responsive CopG/Arc/MetJ family transcriptional regulator